MIRSMTGFGKGETTENGTRITVEISSVNGRYFDLRARLPRILNEYEQSIRSLSQEYIERGRVSITVNLSRSSSRSKRVEADMEVAEKYRRMAADMAERLGVEDRLDTATLLSLPEVVTWEEDDTAAESLWELVRPAMVRALDGHRAMRDREGGAMLADIRTRLANITGSLDTIRENAPGVARINAERLRGKIDSLLGAEQVDEQRIAMEVALYADKVDVTEECVRFASHCTQFEHEIDTGKASGRKLSFLLQEMNREANTIGSKISDAAIAQTVVAIKEELEKIREQVENIE